MNRLFVAYKPTGISSNRFLGQLKRKYNVKKAGFSGTLDPFAKGVLTIGFGSCTKFFRFLKKTPKVYRATLWLGLKSLSLDTENVVSTKVLKPFAKETVLAIFQNFAHELTYTPPIFSAKSIDGCRAYELARLGKKVELKKITSTIYDIKLIHYNHPFITFEATVSEGTYIRSIGEIIAKQLHVDGALSALERLKEGDFIYDNETPLDIRKMLFIEENFYKKDIEDIRLGKKLALEDFVIQDEGTYFIDGGSFLSVIKIIDGKIKYELGGIMC